MSAPLRTPQTIRREYPQAPVVGIAAIVLHEHKILLIRRGQEPLKGHWSLPGGALELGETLEQGVQREIFEETGLDVEPIEIIATFDRIHRDEQDKVRYHYVLIDFLCAVKGGTLASASDADEARWVEHSELNSHSIYALEPFTVTVIEKAWEQARQRGLVA
jgi:ADP-ribose pyrophosphatase YjhB (NUDIX family)